MFNDGYSPHKDMEKNPLDTADDTSCFVVYPGVIFWGCGQVVVLLLCCFDIWHCYCVILTRYNYCLEKFQYVNSTPPTFNSSKEGKEKGMEKQG